MQRVMFWNRLSKTQPKNFAKTSSILKKPKNLGLMHEMHEEWRNWDTYQWRNTWSRPKNNWEWSLEWRDKGYWERLKRNEAGFARTLYIEAHNSRQIKRYREVLNFKGSTATALEQLSKGFRSKEARWIEVAIEHPEGFSMDQSSYRECNKKQMKGLDG